MDKRDKPLLLVWIALLLLLAATASIAMVPLGPWNSVISLAIAALKAALVLLFFMRLRSSHALIRLTAAVGVSTLCILFALAATDYLSRDLPAAPFQAPRQLAPALR